MAQQLYFQKIWKLAAVTVNWIRIFLILLYTLTAAASYTTAHTIMLTGYAAGLTAMSVYCFIACSVLRKGLVIDWFNRLGITVDAPVIGGVIFLSSFLKEQTAWNLQNALLYIVVVFVIVYSAFLGSPRFTVIIGVMLALIVAATFVNAHYYSGVVFTTEAARLQLPNHLSLSREAFKVVFILSSAFIISRLLDVLLRLKDETEHLYQNAEQLIDRIELQRSAIEDSVKHLSESIEAARAGDAGRGVAVVANEVSRLAEFTADNAKKISIIVRGAVIGAVSQMYSSYEGLNSALINRIAHINEYSTKVFEAIEEQLKGQTEIARTMENFEKDIQRITEDSTMLRNRIGTIRQQAERLLSLSARESTQVPG
jgi:methyl-accepting chemotaxis protein